MGKIDAAKQYGPYWAELAFLIEDLQMEKNHAPRPDWRRVEAKAQNLLNLAKAALRDEEEPASHV